MAETLFITPAEIAGTTILGGNVSREKYVVNILFSQISVIEPLLGSELYEKIVSDVEGDTLSGLYETMFHDYIKPIVKHDSLAEYVEVSAFSIDNGGSYKHTAENREMLSREEISTLSGKYRGIAQMYVQRFNKWICKNMAEIPEYKRYQDKVNAQKVNVSLGWYLGGSFDKSSIPLED